MIRFFIKSVIFLTLILVAISFFGPTSKKNTTDGQATETSTLDALMAVKDTVSDMGGFCERNSETCETGKSFLGSLGERARDGAKIAYEYLDAQFGDRQKNTALKDEPTQSNVVEQQTPNSLPPKTKAP